MRTFPRLPSMLARLPHPYLLLTLTTLFWSGNMVIGRAIRDEVPPISLAFWRWAIALAAGAAARPAAPARAVAAAETRLEGGAVLGLLGVGGYNTWPTSACNTRRRPTPSCSTPSSRSPPSRCRGSSSAST
jgi:hypothetical protein